MTSPHAASVAWSIPGSDDEPILGNTHLPTQGEQPRGIALILHGFLGYKDYGMFPHIATQVAASGWIAHRFNMSHSGMTNEIETFQRPDLFTRDTWNRQVFDTNAVIQAAMSGELPGDLPADGLPYVLIGHSRGGATSIMTAGRRFRDGIDPLPRGVVTLAGPSYSSRLTSEQESQLIEVGWAPVVSGRTGQTLKIGRDWITEQRSQPADHDVLGLASKITCPVLLVHGKVDPTVPPRCANELAGAIGDSATRVFVDDGDHVFNTSNPMDAEAMPSEQLATVVKSILGFLEGVGGS